MPAPREPLPEISVVIPTYHEQENVRAIARAVIAELERVRVESFEIIFIDNASNDETVPIIRELCAEDRRIKLIVNTRNFGQMRSPTHGIYQTTGRGVIAMCADFQDPPAMLGEFIARWRAGAPIVLGVRRSEPVGPLLGLARWFSYHVANRLMDTPLIPNATGFGIYDRRVVDQLKQICEPEPLFRAMLVESGFAIETVPFDRPPRAAGESKNGFRALAGFALSGFSSSSKKLLRAPLLLVLPCALIGIASLIWGVVKWCMGEAAFGWLAAGAIEVQFALVFLALGLIGDQLRLNAERGRNTPLVIEAERVNF